MKTLLCIAGAAFASLGIAGPASAKLAGVSLQWPCSPLTTLHPTPPPVKQIYVRVSKMHRGHSKCEAVACDTATNCAPCDERDCLDGTRPLS